METTEKLPGFSSAAANAETSASLLGIFHEDIILCILGFVADVPFEVVENHGGEYVYYFCLVLLVMPGDSVAVCVHWNLLMHYLASLALIH